MRSMTFDPSNGEAIEKMFEALIGDITSEKNEEQIGWRTCDEIGLNPAIRDVLLASRLLIENSEGKVRINFKDYRIRQQLKDTFEVRVAQLEYLSEVQRDKDRIDKANEILGHIFELVRQSPESWTNIIALGGWKMLQTSGLPAILDDVLEKGFSPENWVVDAVASCPKLALDLAQKWGEIEQFDDAIVFLDTEKIKLEEPISITPLPNNDVINKVETILRWTETKQEMTEQSIKVLTFFWFIFLVLEHMNLLPCSSEYSVKLFDNVWTHTEELLGKNQVELVSELENMKQILDEKGIAWVPEVMCFPEVIT